MEELHFGSQAGGSHAGLNTMNGETPCLGNGNPRFFQSSWPPSVQLPRCETSILLSCTPRMGAPNWHSRCQNNRTRPGTTRIPEFARCRASACIAFTYSPTISVQHVHTVKLRWSASKWKSRKGCAGGSVKLRLAEALTCFCRQNAAGNRITTALGGAFALASSFHLNNIMERELQWPGAIRTLRMVNSLSPRSITTFNTGFSPYSI